MKSALSQHDLLITCNALALPILIYRLDNGTITNYNAPAQKLLELPKKSNRQLNIKMFHPSLQLIKTAKRSVPTLLSYQTLKGKQIELLLFRTKVITINKIKCKIEYFDKVINTKVKSENTLRTSSISSLSGRKNKSDQRSEIESEISSSLPKNKHNVSNHKSISTLLLSNVPGMIYNMLPDKKGNMVFRYVSEGSLKLFGIQAEDLMKSGASLFSLIHNEDISKVRSTIKDASSTSKNWSLEFRVSIMGIEKWISAVSTLHKQTSGQNTWYGFMQDVTEIKRVNHQISNLTDTIPDGFIYEFWQSSDGINYRLNYVSQGCEQLFEVNADEALKNVDSLFSKIHPDDVDQFFKVVNEKRSVSGKFDIDYRIVMNDKRIKWVNGRANVRLLPDNSTIIEGIALDITRQKLLENNIAKNETRLRSIIQTEPNCVKVLNEKCNLIEMNASGLDLIEADELSQVLGHSVLNIIDPEFREQFSMLTHHVINGTPGTLEFSITGLKGTKRWLETHAVPLPDEQSNKNLLLGITRDITAVKNYQDNLLKSLHEKELLIKEIHHRIKNNLQLISSILFLRMNAMEQSTIKVFLTETRQKIKSVALIHEQLLQTGSVNQVDISCYLNNLISELKTTVKENDRIITITANIESQILNLDVAINCGLILNEIVTNAVKHAFLGRQHGSIEVLLIKREEKLEFTIADDGIGLPNHITLGGNGFGMQMIDLFAKQLLAHVEINRTIGTCYKIVFNC